MVTESVIPVKDTLVVQHIGVGTHFLVGGPYWSRSQTIVSGYADKGGIVPDDIRLVSCSQLVLRDRQRKKSRTPRGEIS